MEFVQIATASIGEGNAVIVALDSAGVLWKKVINPSDGPGRSWTKIPPPEEHLADDDAPLGFIP